MFSAHFPMNMGRNVFRKCILIWHSKDKIWPIFTIWAIFSQLICFYIKKDTYSIGFTGETNLSL